MDQQDRRWKRLYVTRSGVEGTICELVDNHRARRCRYHGLRKTHVQHVLTAIATAADRAEYAAPTCDSPPTYPVRDGWSPSALGSAGSSVRTIHADGGRLPSRCQGWSVAQQVDRVGSSTSWKRCGSSFGGPYPRERGAPGSSPSCLVPDGNVPIQAGSSSTRASSSSKGRGRLSFNLRCQPRRPRPRKQE
ncbi:transposase [Streptomyces vietnamensis]|uniref:transposase n=1 Tax=Streptomyces vietnamensis TaxID=362257 RepID=UPI000D1492A0|nr:transposase [Streptomyces vietnamensis]